MAVTKVQICNMALTHIGIKQLITAIDDDNEEANMCELYYDTALENALHEADWGFARRRVTLNLQTGDAPEPWQYQYVYPTDCIRPLRIWDKRKSRLPEDEINFTRETNDSDVALIYTDMEDAVLIYTYNETDPTKFSPPFVRYLSYVLAGLIAMPLTGSEEMQEKMEQRAMHELSKAFAKDANSEQEPFEEEASWMQARDGGRRNIPGTPADQYWDDL